MDVSFRRRTVGPSGLACQFGPSYASIFFSKSCPRRCQHSSVQRPLNAPLHMPSTFSAPPRIAHSPYTSTSAPHPSTVASHSRLCAHHEIFQDVLLLDELCVFLRHRVSVRQLVPEGIDCLLHLLSVSAGSLPSEKRRLTCARSCSKTRAFSLFAILGVMSCH